VRQHWRYAEWLVEALDARVVMPDYPVVPGNSWRDAHPPVLAAFRQVTAESDDLTLLGDSAGAGFAVAVAQQIVAEGGPSPERLVVFSVWMDLSMETGVSPADAFLTREYLRLAGELWADADQLTLPALSPIFGSFQAVHRDPL